MPYQCGCADESKDEGQPQQHRQVRRRLYVSLESGSEHRARQGGAPQWANFPGGAHLKHIERRPSEYGVLECRTGLLRSRDRHDVDLRFELPVVGEVTHEFQIESFEYKNSAVRNHFTVIGEPGLVVHLALPDLQRAAAVHLGQEACSEFEVFDELDLGPMDLCLDSSTQIFPLMIFRIFRSESSGNVARTGSHDEYQCFSTFQVLFSGKRKVKGLQSLIPELLFLAAALTSLLFKFLAFRLGET